MTKTINITQHDIDHGRRQSFCECPVARAVRRAFRAKPERTIVVRHEGVFVGDIEDARMWLGLVDAPLSRFIATFDKGRTVKPAAFRVHFQ